MVRIQGIYVGSRRDFVEMNKAIWLGQLRPVGEEFHWTQAREVLRADGRGQPLWQAGALGGVRRLGLKARRKRKVAPGVGTRIFAKISGSAIRLVTAWIPRSENADLGHSILLRVCRTRI